MNWMKKLYSIRKFSGLVLIAIFILSCEQKKETTSRVSTLPFYREASFTPHWLASDSDELVSFHKVPSFSLTNQNGETITDKTFANKIYVTDFFFTSCPGICPKMTANMAVLQEAFKEDSEILLLSHSVTPETDSVPVLKTYAQEKGVDVNKWHLVTGPRSEIYSLGRNTYFVEEDLGEIKTDDDFLHTENFVLVDKNSHIRGIYNGLNKTSVNQLIADIKTLKSES